MYRDNLEAAHQRIVTLEEDNRRLKEKEIDSDMKNGIVEIILSKLLLYQQNLDIAPGSNTRKITEDIANEIARIYGKEISSKKFQVRKDVIEKGLCKICSSKLREQDLYLYVDNSRSILCKHCWFAITRLLPTGPISPHHIKSISVDYTKAIYYVHQVNGFVHAISEKQINMLVK